MFEKLQEWLQSYMDAYTVGSVNWQICDGVIGNFTLQHLQTQVKEESRSLEGNLLVKYESQFRLLYLSTSVEDRWMEDLCRWRYQVPPDFLLGVSTTGCRVRSDGIVEFTGLLTIRYEERFNREDV